VFSEDAKVTTKLIFLVVVSCLLSFAAVLMVLEQQFNHALYVIACGAFIGWSAVAFRGRLPNWVREHWGIADDSAPGNLPVRIWLPILAVVIVVAGLLFFYVVRR
jgi:hypothetical protein